MKTLKFTPALMALILAEEKTTTWRVADEKDLRVGDSIQLVNKATLTPFGIGKICNIDIRTLGTLAETDWDGHEKFSSDEKMYETYRRYYGPKTGPHSEVKIVRFTLHPVNFTRQSRI